MVAETLDEALRSALYAAAGNLQADVAEVGFAGIYESDLRRSLGRALHSHTGAHVVAERRLPETTAWTAPPQGFDLAVEHDGELAAAFELKWCRQVGNLAEAMWDVLKLVAFTRDGAVQAFLIYAASQRVWSKPGKHPHELFGGGAHEVTALLEQYDADWRWLLTGNKTARPARLPATFTTTPVAAVPILSATEPDWELRCARVEATGSNTICFEESGWPTPAAPAGPAGPKR